MLFDAEKIAEWSGGVWEPFAPGSVCGVSNNSRAVEPGELYVAIRGENFDGHTFVADAFDNGAIGAMVDRDSMVDGTDANPVLRVDNSVAALGRFAAGYCQDVGPVIVGVTGSVGKSTVKEMLASVLAVAMPTAKTMGNFNNDIGLPLSLLAMEGDARVGVFEVGMNHPGEIGALCKLLQPQWGVVTSIGPVHIEFFDSVEDIAREKGELLRALPVDGHAVLCSDDPYFETLRSCIDCTLLTVSMDGSADYVVSYSAGGNLLSVCESASSEKMEIEWLWPGRHNALNAGYAVAVARGMGLGWDDIAKGLADYHPLAMRWDVEDVYGIQVINDAYNANPLSMRAALQAYEESDVAGEKWLVLGAMNELGSSSEGEHLALGEYVAKGIWDGVILMGEAGKTIAAGMKGNEFYAEKIRCCESTADAVAVLYSELKSEDGVLLKASRSVALENVVEGLKNRYEEES